MEDFEEARERAKKHIKIADHMLTQTYPLVQDPKLLVAVMENLYNALDSSICSILYYERYYKKIPPFHDGFDSRLDLFRARCTRRYTFKRDYIPLVQTVREILHEHKESPFEFSRKGKFFICSDDYNMKSVSVDKLKEFIQQGKEFVADMEQMVARK